MLRITVQKRPGSITLKLEGKLAGPWVGELAKTWSSLSAAEPLLVDLCEVSFVDASGESLLARMYKAGADLMAVSPLMKHVIEQVTSPLPAHSESFPSWTTRCRN
jgi:anti-anti-sigma regulatory factor